MLIRPVQAGDGEAIRKLIEELTGQPTSDDAIQNRILFIEMSPTDELHVCEIDGQIQGVLGFRIRENIEEVSRYGEISIIVTHSQARRRGIGRKLMEYAETHAQANKCKGTWLVSGLGREEEAHKFYKSLGYEITGYRFVKPLETGR